MEKETTKLGLVGFFDILGYQNLLERNEPEKIAKEVLPILTNIGDRVVNNLQDIHNVITSDIRFKKKSSIAEKQLKIIKTISWLVFSDTVLLTLPIEEKDHYWVNFSWMIFLVATIFIQRELFQAGLPSRGVIEYG